MVTYRRSLLAGGSFFFTINLAERQLRLLTDNIDLLRSAFRYAQARHPFTVEAIVVLPDHLHAVFSLPEGDADYALRLRLIKTHFSRHLPRGERRSASRIAKAESQGQGAALLGAPRMQRGIWQRRYWEHTLRDDQDYARHVDYIHFNPVKHGHLGASGISSQRIAGEMESNAERS